MVLMQREYSALDQVLIRLHGALGSYAAPSPAAKRDNPADGTPEPELDAAGRKHAAGLMRVNHAGEVAAQALYRGQAATAQNPALRQHLLDAAAEEQAHLGWCRQRLSELGESPSRLDPLWYAGSYAIGALAGLAGDKFSLGFVEETEKQVAEHLGGHLDRLPADDRRSRAIVAAMKRDEERHGREAAEAGAAELPAPVRGLMRAVASVMTRSAYWL